MAAKEKVLVADDEPRIQKYLRTLLEVEGFDVQVVSSGMEALVKIKEGERPDYIILDMLMPEIGGIETLDEIMHVDRRLTAFMTSCSGACSTVVEAIRLGARDFLVLPFEDGELVRAMRSPAGRKKRRQILSTSCVVREISPWAYRTKFQTSVSAPLP
jgi:DNA-binding NtrC family response regulator